MRTLQRQALRQEADPLPLPKGGARFRMPTDCLTTNSSTMDERPRRLRRQSSKKHKLRARARSSNGPEPSRMLKSAILTGNGDSNNCEDSTILPDRCPLPRRKVGLFIAPLQRCIFTSLVTYGHQSRQTCELRSLLANMGLPWPSEQYRAEGRQKPLQEECTSKSPDWVDPFLMLTASTGYPASLPYHVVTK